jgi:hypothetical protein
VPLLADDPSTGSNCKDDSDHTATTSDRRRPPPPETAREGCGSSGC